MYLGRNIFKALAQNPAVATIHCAAVRDTTRMPYFTPTSATAAHIIVHAGDLGAPRLGLSQAAFNKLAREADVLVHSGADRSFWDSYQTLRGANVTSTKTMIQLAARRRVPLHFLSSSGLVAKPSSLSLTAASITALTTPPADGSNGYLASKWAAEANLERAGRELGVPVRIHRVTGMEPADGKSIPAALVTQLRNEPRAVAAALQAVPQHGGWRGSFDVLRTSTLSARLVELFVAGEEAREDGGSSRYFNYPSEVHLDMDAVSDVFDGVEGDLETLPPHVWAGRAKAVGIDWHFSGQDFEDTFAQGMALRR